MWEGKSNIWSSVEEDDFLLVFISMKFRSNQSVDFFLAVLLGLLFSVSKTVLYYFPVNESFVSREDPLILIKNVL